MEVPKRLSEGVQYLRIRAGAGTPLYLDHRLTPADATTFLREHAAGPATYTISAKNGDQEIQEPTTGQGAAQLLNDLSESRDGDEIYTFDSWTDDGHAYARISTSYDEATSPERLRNQPPLTRNPVEVEVFAQFGGAEQYTAADVKGLLSADEE